MTAIQFQYSRKAEKFLNKHEDVRDEFKKDIRKLIENDHPEQVDYKRLKGSKAGYSRIRIREYRIIFTIIKDKIVIVNVVAAGSRGDIYK